MLVGFTILLLAMCAGVFVAFDADKAFLFNKEILSTWQYALQKSAHGHLALFGYFHILFGLSLPYSGVSPQSKIAQTIGICSGSFAMSVLMFLRSLENGPKVVGIDVLGTSIGVCLSLSMLALFVHIYGLLLKMIR